MVRKIIHIDEEKCDGCGLCAKACHEGAIDIVDGKARLARESFCDGFGDCLPNCPQGAISFEEREAPAYDENAVQQDKLRRAGIFAAGKRRAEPVPCSSAAAAIERCEADSADSAPERGGRAVSRLGQWPCQIKLVPTEAEFFRGAKLLIAADCSAYAYAAMHEDFMKGRVTLIGCPKLDAVDYSEKLAEILAGNDVRSLTVVRMEVPCCGALQRAAEKALHGSGKNIPWNVVTISRDGRIIDSLV